MVGAVLTELDTTTEEPSGAPGDEHRPLQWTLTDEFFNFPPPLSPGQFPDWDDWVCDGCKSLRKSRSSISSAFNFLSLQH